MRRLFTAALAGSLLLAVAAPAASAAKPERFVVDQAEFTDIVDEIVEDACGIELETTMTGHVIISIWFDAQGNPDREIDRYSTRFTFRNAATGAVYRFADAGPDILQFNWDDGTIVYSLIGRSATGSGYAGRVVLLVDLETGEPIGDPLQVSGHELGDWVENVCDAVA